MYHWFKDGLILKNETKPMLRVTPISGSDGGTYTCVVTNAAGNGSASATLYITPTIVIQPTNISVVVGTTGNLTCVAEAFPPPLYMWDHLDGSIAPSIAGRNGNVLIFNTVSLADMGKYVCIVTSNGTVRSNIAYLNGEQYCLIYL